MSYEVSSVGFDEFEESSRWVGFDPNPHIATFHEVIFSGPSDFYHVERVIQFGNKTRSVAQQCRVSSVDASVGGKAEITVGWGGKDGTTISGSISGSVSDSNGNKAEVKVEVENDGSGTATVSAEHTEQSKSLNLEN